MASICKIEGVWRALIRRKGHKSISKRFPKKAEAEAWARKVEAGIDSGDSPLDSPTVTISQLVQKYRTMRERSRPIADDSSEHYTLKMLSATLGGLVAADVSTEDVVGWANHRRESGAGPYTINCDLSKLGTVLRYAGDGLPDVVGKARPILSHLGLIGGGGKRERRPTEDELVRVTEWLEREKGMLYADIVRFAVLTAMRRGEIVGLRWADLDESKRLVLVRDRKDPRVKMGNDQWVPLLGAAWGVALRQPRAAERIFPAHEQTTSKYFKAACDALGVPDLHFHDLRHEGVSRLFEEGYSIEQVAVVSGHKDWRHLRRYTQIKPESLHRGRSV